MWYLWILALLLGLAFGYLRPGRENKTGLLIQGVVIGIVLGIIFGLIGLFTGTGFWGTGIGTLIDIIVYTVLFIVGAFIGDLIEGSRR